MDARSKALQHFRKEKRSSRDSFELPVKKVSVMADSEKGLEEGLEKAKDILGKDPKSMMAGMMGSDEDSMESPDEESSEMEMKPMSEDEVKACSHDELVQKFMELQEKLNKEE